ncbi:thiosulfate oxidation carrier complex protein SoxZ [Methylomonas sp. CM2]|uniref:thiosulfate oxidation carrier complex protein SoxZ n=1 Tax=Methylomonas sp. CM2 TaxID=3417647 RepID=UPI003CEFF393
MSTIKIRSRALAGFWEIRILNQHPMENGRNRDTDGALIPAHYIQTLTLTLNGTPTLSVNMAGSVSKNPFFVFRLRASIGDRISVMWLDNLGNQDRVEHQLVERDD